MSSQRLRDLSPSTEEFLGAVLDGLSSEPKTLPCKFFYDETGARLFEAICTLDAYYPTRTELQILSDHAHEIADVLGPRVRLVEPGAGSLTKARFLLERLQLPTAFVPIDISREQLAEAARVLAQDFPGVLVQPVCADFTVPVELPRAPDGTRRTVVFYPGSTIGNFEPDEAVEFLARMRKLVGQDGAVLVGVDLKKDVDVLMRAYDDPVGITAAFDKNLLARINRELEGDFDLTAFEHRARYQAEPSRVVIELVSRREQTVTVSDRDFRLAPGEPIVTEYSHKPTLAGFASLATRAGLSVEHVWTDPQRWFSLQLLRAV